MSEQEAYDRMVALWERQRKGQPVDLAEVVHAQNTYVRLVRARIGDRVRPGQHRPGYVNPGGKGKTRKGRA